MKIKMFTLALMMFSILACQKKSEETVIADQQGNSGEVTVTQLPASVSETTAAVSNVKTTEAPEFMNLEMQGFGVPDTNLNNFYGEVIFLNHWGSWCGPCRIEMPSIQELYNKYGDKVKFVMIATERRPGAHVPYIEKEGFTFPVYSMTSPASTEIKPKGYPTTIIIDRQGQIRTNDVGAANWNAPNVHEFLDGLIAEN